MNAFANRTIYLGLWDSSLHIYTWLILCVVGENVCDILKLQPSDTEIIISLTDYEKMCNSQYPRSNRVSPGEDVGWESHPRPHTRTSSSPAAAAAPTVVRLAALSVSTSPVPISARSWTRRPSRYSSLEARVVLQPRWILELRLQSVRFHVHLHPVIPRRFKTRLTSFLSIRQSTIRSSSPPNTTFILAAILTQTNSKQSSINNIAIPEYALALSHWRRIAETVSRAQHLDAGAECGKQHRAKRISVGWWINFRYHNDN
jgi:hypothetical protein